MSQQLSSFDPATHQYRHNGIIVPHTTGVLLAEGLYKGHEYFTEAGRLFGSYVHLATQWDDLGKLDYEKLDPPLKGCVDSYCLFKEQTGFKPILIERSLTSDLGIGGTPDRYGTFRDGKRVVPDLKCGNPQPADRIQTAIYQLLLEANGYPVDCRGSLYLKRDGTLPKWIPHTKREDFAIAHSILTTYNFKRNMGLI